MVTDRFSFCRVMFGNNHLFVLHHPKDKELLKKQEEAQKAGNKFEEETQSFEKAQEEIAQNSGLMNYGAATDRSDGKKSPGVSSMRYRFLFYPFLLLL